MHPSPHLAGQHYIVRLTAPDGYTASRSYSVASPPDGSNAIDLTVERLEDGEVSTFLHDEVVIGDELEVRGPIGGSFVWKADTPAILVGGGSGIVPLMSMLRLARKTGKSDLVHLVVSVRSPDDLFYADELPGPETTILYTRESPPGFARAPGTDLGRRRRAVDHARLTAYVCGRPTSPTRPAISSWTRSARAPGARGALRPDRLKSEAPETSDGLDEEHRVPGSDRRELVVGGVGAHAVEEHTDLYLPATEVGAEDVDLVGVGDFDTGNSSTCRLTRSSPVPVACRLRTHWVRPRGATR